jgi:hypothetical protein
MTNKQQKIFGEILDLNHNMRHEKSGLKKLSLWEKLIKKQAQLKKDMGESEYAKFMDAGQKMFS